MSDRDQYVGTFYPNVRPLTIAERRARKRTESLADFLTEMPLDWVDADGVRDTPEDYDVVQETDSPDGFRIVARGPSGDLDFVVADGMEVTFYRDTDYELLFSSGDGVWTIERAPDGLLCVSSNAETRRVLESWSYIGWEMDKVRENLVNAGVTEAVADECIRQVER